MEEIEGVRRPLRDFPGSSSPGDIESNTVTASEDDIAAEAAPEKKIILWTIVIAAIEQTADALGTMNFIWATVVLLGGFAPILKSIDFWFVSIILTAEGLRILGRRGELETEAASCWRIAPNLDGRITWLTFYSATMQGFSSVTGGSLSAIRLWWRDYGGDDNGNDNGNRTAALIIFYVLSLVEALMILFGFAFKIDLGLWPFWGTNPGRLGRFVSMGMIRPGKLVLKVTKDYGFGDSKHSIVRRFFYETFSRCVNGSVFEGLKMDFVSYTVNLVQSNNPDEQLTGAEVLLSLLQSDRFVLKTLRTISKKQGVAEMLIEMLTWKSPHEKHIRTAAAKIIEKLVEKEPNGIWVRAVTRSMDSVASLLYGSNKIGRHSRSNGAQSSAYDYSFFSSLGLRILEILAKDNVNCTKIGRNRGLLRKVIAITELTLDPLDWQISAVLKTVAIDILTSVAHEQKELLESIGAKGLVLHNLISLFFMERTNDMHAKVLSDNAEALRAKAKVLSPEALSANAEALSAKALRAKAKALRAEAEALRAEAEAFKAEALRAEAEAFKAKALCAEAQEALCAEAQEALSAEAQEALSPEAQKALRAEQKALRAEQEALRAEQEALSAEAGEALSVLSLENEENCKIMMRSMLGNHPNMIASLISIVRMNSEQFFHVARILRNLLVYADEGLVRRTEIFPMAPQVVDFVTGGRDAFQEAAIGLAVQIFKFMTESDFNTVFGETGSERTQSLTETLRRILQTHTRPSKKVPRIRRFSVELLILLAKMDRSKIALKTIEEQALKKISQKISKSKSSIAVGLSTGALDVIDLLEDNL